MDDGFELGWIGILRAALRSCFVSRLRKGVDLFLFAFHGFARLIPTFGSLATAIALLQTRARLSAP